MLLIFVLLSTSQLNVQLSQKYKNLLGEHLNYSNPTTTVCEGMYIYVQDGGKRKALDTHLPINFLATIVFIGKLPAMG